MNASNPLQFTRTLEVMKHVVSGGNFQNIELWLLTLSDDEYPILTEANRMTFGGLTISLTLSG